MQFEQSGYDFYIDDILNVVDLSADRRWKLNNLSYPNQWVLSYTVNGDSIVYQMNDTTVLVKKNSILFFPVNFQRSAICDSDEPARLIVIKFSMRPANKETDDILRSIPNYIPTTPVTMQKMFETVGDIWCRKHPGYAIRCKGLLYELLYELLNQSELMKNRHQYDKRLKKAIEAIESTDSRHFSVQELASLCELSPSYFQNIFKQYTGYSPNQYQNYIKMGRARDLLLSGHYTVTEVASILGYMDVGYFCRIFKKVMGVSPKQAIK